MINLLVFGTPQNDSKYKPGLSKHILNLLEIQIQNSLNFGWKPHQLLLASNLSQHSFSCENCLIDFSKYGNINPTVYKWVGIYEILKKYPNETIIYHDCDCYQIAPFIEPKIDKIGMARYYKRYNTGFIIINYKGLPIVENILNIAKQNPNLVDEKVVKQLNNDIITQLNSRYNVGVTAFSRRYESAIKPVLFIHAHLERKSRFNKFKERNLLPQYIIESFPKQIFKAE